MYRLKIWHLSTWLLFALSNLFGITASYGQKDSTMQKDGVPIVKGTWFVGGTISGGTRKADNDAQLFAYLVDQKKSDIEIRLDGGYVFKENLAAGVGLLYGRISETNTTKSSDGILTENEISGSTMAFRPFIKNFIPLGKSDRFYVVIPTELQIGYGSRVQESTTQGVMTRSFTESNYYGIAMRPGLLAFIYKNFGFEVNVGAFGLSTKTERTRVSGNPDGKVTTNDLDLKINILNLSLGFSGYF
jgi:hypothetical protein